VEQKWQTLNKLAKNRKCNYGRGCARDRSAEAGFERSEACGRREQAAVYRGQKTIVVCPQIVPLVEQKWQTLNELAKKP
jgi:hypothetical protein